MSTLLKLAVEKAAYPSPAECGIEPWDVFLDLDDQLGRRPGALRDDEAPTLASDEDASMI